MHESMRQSGDTANPRASFHQKSARVSLIVLIAVALFYGANLVTLLPSTAPSIAAATPLAVTTLILIIVVEAVLHAVLAIGAGNIAAPSERDRVAALQASRNAYLLLVAGMLVTVVSAFWGATTFVMTHLALLFLVLAEVSKFASQLMYYRQRTTTAAARP